AAVAARRRRARPRRGDRARGAPHAATGAGTGRRIGLRPPPRAGQNLSERNGARSMFVGLPAISWATSRPVVGPQVRPRWPWPKAYHALANRLAGPITGSESGVAGRCPIHSVPPAVLRPG